MLGFAGNEAWTQVGSNTPLTSRFARWRLRPVHDDARRSEPAAEEWLLIERPEGVAEPAHYWFSTLPADISFETLDDVAMMSGDRQAQPKNGDYQRRPAPQPIG
jgi:hypothetical protein